MNINMMKKYQELDDWQLRSLARSLLGADILTNEVIVVNRRKEEDVIEVGINGQSVLFNTHNGNWQVFDEDMEPDVQYNVWEAIKKLDDWCVQY